MVDGPHLGDLSPAGSIAIGIIVGLASTSIQSIGLTLQRKSHLLEDLKHHKFDAADISPYRPPYRRRRWQLGMLMFVVSNLVGSTIQITTLPLPVLSTLQASGLVFNTLCASLILHEPFTIWSFIGTALVAGGALMIALFGALAEPSHTLSQLLVLLGRRQFLLWMMGTFFIIAVILVAVLVLNRLHPHSQSRRVRVARGFAYGGISSILSAHSLLVAKSAVELLVRTIVDRHNQFNRWESWVIVLLLIVLALSQLYFLHRGLKLVSTSILYPFVFCIYNIIAILDGLIYFRQTQRIGPLHAGLIALGTVILLSGVLALSWRTQEDEERETQPPPEVHSLLTPGMGIVEDTTTEDERGASGFDDSDIDDDNASTTSADEEARLAPSEVTALLASTKGATQKTTKRRGIRRLHKTEQAPDLTSTPRRKQIFESPTVRPHDPTNVATTLPRPATTHPNDSPYTSTTPLHQRPQFSSATQPGENGSASSPDSIEDTPLPPLATRPVRARTVHGNSVSFARGPPMSPGAAAGMHTRTWREADRERRRRRWSLRRREDGDADVGGLRSAGFDARRRASMPVFSRTADEDEAGGGVATVQESAAAESRREPESLTQRLLGTRVYGRKRTHSRNVSSTSWFSALMGRRPKGDVGSASEGEGEGGGEGGGGGH